MKFALPLLLSAVALASLTWFITNLNPVELPPGVRVKEKTTPVLTAK
ncbi:MAG TPA: hypothetical protein VM511_13005 [Luteolibacter sp.]|nr:hypothetical protein [Luteolibacter sp.]